MSERVIVVYHLCTLGPAWRAIQKEQLDLFARCGLLAACSEFLLSVVGEHAPDWQWPSEWRAEDLKKCSVAYRDKNPRRFERSALNIVRDRCVLPENERALFLYWHSKGVTKPTSLPVQCWRRYMNHFLIENWQLAVHTLRCGYDVVGVNYRPAPVPHFSGNYWLATGSYLRRLAPHTIGSGYLDPEMWILNKKPRWWALHNTPRDLYHHAYLPEHYKNRVLVPTFDSSLLSTPVPSKVIESERDEKRDKKECMTCAFHKTHPGFIDRRISRTEEKDKPTPRWRENHEVLPSPPVGCKACEADDPWLKQIGRVPRSVAPLLSEAE